MDGFAPGQAREQAIRDWNAQEARDLVVGTLAFDIPTYYKYTLFYTSTFGCTPSADDEIYCREYNRTIRWLVEKYGAPDWAPVKRLPTACSVLESLRTTAQDFSTYAPASAQEESVVRYVLSHWKGRSPILWARLQQPCLLVLGGDHTDQVGRVDVIDTLNEVKWMAFYQYPCEEYPMLPWKMPGQQDEREPRAFAAGPVGIDTQSR